MLCTSCKSDQSNGTFESNVFICNSCIAKGLAGGVVKKKPTDSMIINVLKRHGLRGDVAYGYYLNPEYPLERLIKNVWLFRYIKSKGYKVANDTAFFTVLLKDNKYPIPDGFWDYMKQKQSSFDGKDFEILYRNI